MQEEYFEMANVLVSWKKENDHYVGNSGSVYMSEKHRLSLRFKLSRKEPMRRRKDALSGIRLLRQELRTWVTEPYSEWRHFRDLSPTEHVIDVYRDFLEQFRYAEVSVDGNILHWWSDLSGDTRICGQEIDRAFGRHEDYVIVRLKDGTNKFVQWNGYGYKPFTFFSPKNVNGERVQEIIESADWLAMYRHPSQERCLCISTVKQSAESTQERYLIEIWFVTHQDLSGELSGVRIYSQTPVSTPDKIHLFE